MKDFKINYISSWDNSVSYSFELAYTKEHAITLFNESSNLKNKIISVEEV